MIHHAVDLILLILIMGRERITLAPTHTAHPQTDAQVGSPSALALASTLAFALLISKQAIAWRNKFTALTLFAKLGTQEKGLSNFSSSQPATRL